jgi:peptidoglycan/xylan/chitin deacetylase (PgdA/CDA1 family)
MRQLFTRRRLIVIAFVLAAALAIAATLFMVSKALCWQLVGQPICHVDTREKLVALTFDDGPTRDGVTYLLGQLKAHDAHATFFLIGGAVAEQPGEVRRIIAAGQEVGNHSYSHDRMWGFFPSPYETEIRRTDTLLRAEGATPTLFRPPYGKKLTGLPIAVERTGYRTVMWDIADPDEAKDARAYADRVLAQVRPGSIILIHAMYSSRAVARAAVPLILDGLAQRGYRAVTVSELLGHASPGAS